MFPRHSVHLIIYFTLDVLLLFFCLPNMTAVVERATTPFQVEQQNGQIVISGISHPNAAPGLQTGDEILTWHDRTVILPEMLELYSDFAQIGEFVPITVNRLGEIKALAVTLVPFYTSPRFAIIMAIIGIAIWCIGIFVAFSRLDGAPAYALHWGLVLLAVSLLLTQGRIVPGDFLSFVRRFGLYFSYMMMAAMFLLFTTLYPRKKNGSTLFKSALIILPSIVSILSTCFFFFQAVRLRSAEAFERFHQLYNLFHFLIALMGIGIIGSVLHSYHRATSKEEIARLQWMFWGFAVAITPFLAGIILPQLFFSKDWIPEEFGTVFLVAAPFSFAVSFVKYHFLDVELVINRSLVYAILTGFIGLIYLLVVLVVTSLIGGQIVFTDYLLVLAVSLIAAFLFHPLRIRLQNIIDEALFPASVHYRKSINEMTEHLHKSFTVTDACRKVVDVSGKLFPFSAIAIYTIENHQLALSAHEEGEWALTVNLSDELRSTLEQNKIVLPRIPIDSLKLFAHNVIVPLWTESLGVLGCIAALPKRAEERLRIEEIDLIKAFASQLAEVIERLTYQRNIVLEQEERKRMEELNRMKSYFVSSVSHELRSPLTSIQMFVETLRTKRSLTSKVRKEYLEIVERESQRLNRLVDNVLDFSRMESGVDKYDLDEMDLRTSVDRAVKAMAYQYKRAHARLHVKCAPRLPRILGDLDALQQAVMNLLANALKYSGVQKDVTLRVRKEKAAIVLSVIDKGIGIPEDELPNIFEQYYRIPSGKTQHVKGAGLGLAVVRHIVDAHGGTIQVKSVVGEGSEFTIRLPLAIRRTEKEDESHSTRGR